MKATWTNEDILKTKTGLLVVEHTGEKENPAFEKLDEAFAGRLSAAAEEEGFKGQEGRILSWRGESPKVASCRILVIGTGKKVLDAGRFRGLLAKAVAVAERHRVKSLAFYVDASKEDAKRKAAWAAESFLLGAYRYDEYKTSVAGNPTPSTAKIGAFPRNSSKSLKEAVEGAKVKARAVVLCRDLVNEPANHLGPAEFASKASKIAKSHGLKCRVLAEAAIKKESMGLLLSVSQGSSKKPRFVHLTYTPPKGSRRRVGLVGKGVTFDSGGLCIKPGKPMAEMKTDMAGAATVLSVMSALKDLQVNVEVHAFIPLAENSINGSASRPSDVVTSRSGKTVEILNTDAEGRLLLADAISFAQDRKMDELLDFATLTGACPVALGASRAGMFSNHDEMAKKYEEAAQDAGELLWRLPLAPELRKDLKSDVADMKNLGGRYGGTITAALFLEKFVKVKRWIHLDIAGPARAESTTPLCKRGGSGYGVFTCLQYLETLR